MSEKTTAVQSEPRSELTVGIYFVTMNRIHAEVMKAKNPDSWAK
jgi:hypothetical protein